MCKMRETRSWTDERIDAVCKLKLTDAYSRNVTEQLMRQMRDEMQVEIDRLVGAGLNAAYSELLYRDELADTL